MLDVTFKYVRPGDTFRIATTVVHHVHKDHSLYDGIIKEVTQALHDAPFASRISKKQKRIIREEREALPHLLSHTPYSSQDLDVIVDHLCSTQIPLLQTSEHFKKVYSRCSHIRHCTWWLQRMYEQVSPAQQKHMRKHYVSTILDLSQKDEDLRDTCLDHLELIFQICDRQDLSPLVKTPSVSVYLGSSALSKTLYTLMQQDDKEETLVPHTH